MKKTTAARRLAMILGACLIIAMLPAAVMAAGVYAPVKGTITYYPDNEEASVERNVSISYKSDGRITKLEDYRIAGSTTGAGPLIRSWSWKGNRITKSAFSYAALLSSQTTYSYREDQLEKRAFRGSTDTAALYQWKKGKASFSDRKNGITGTLKADKNGRIIEETWDENGDIYSSKTRYYKNGNIKSRTESFQSEDQADYKVTRKYNSAGYITSVKTRDSLITYSYLMDLKKNSPKKITVIRKDLTKNKEAPFVLFTYNFTKYQKVKSTRNCDQNGIEFLLFAENGTYPSMREGLY